jgi:pre-mRNA-splicing factor ATP-dependent RNA helicase DHX38/PRP16
VTLFTVFHSFLSFSSLPFLSSPSIFLFILLPSAFSFSSVLSSGVVARTTVDGEVDDDQEFKVHILVHDIKPPFLDGRIVFTKQQDAVCPVKDPTSDFAQLARKGSQLLKEVREQRDRQKSQKRFWEIAGSKMGDVLGVKRQESEEEKAEREEVKGDDGEVNYRSSSQYASHMQAKSQAVR